MAIDLYQIFADSHVYRPHGLWYSVFFIYLVGYLHIFNEVKRKLQQNYFLIIQNNCGTNYTEMTAKMA